MSLTHALARSQQHLPDAVLDQCSEADRVIVENIGLVAQETLPALHLAQATIVQDGRKYLLRIPFTELVASVTLRELASMVMRLACRPRWAPVSAVSIIRRHA